jgi:hypothetical protein
MELLILEISRRIRSPEVEKLNIQTELGIREAFRMDRKTVKEKCFTLMDLGMMEND